jgi:hypothetical protein
MILFQNQRNQMYANNRIGQQMSHRKGICSLQNDPNRVYDQAFMCAGEEIGEEIAFKRHAGKKMQSQGRGDVHSRLGVRRLRRAKHQRGERPERAEKKWVILALKRLAVFVAG